MDTRWMLIIGIVNLAVFLLYGRDKMKAQRGGWRTPEATLLLAAVFGVIGAWLGMKVFHHKTRKAKFRIGVPLIALLEMAAALAIHQFL